jgi:hypothetical protein
MDKKRFTINPLLLDNITRDGSSRDFESMLDDFRKVFKIILPEYVSVDYEDDYGVGIAQFILWMIDNLNYQLDFYVQQRTKKYCRSRQALQDITEWFSWFIPSHSPATTDEQRIYLSEFPTGHSDGLLIPKGTLLATNLEIEGDIVNYETDEDLILDKQFLTVNATGNNEVIVSDLSNYQINMKCEIKNDSSVMNAVLVDKDETSDKLIFDRDIPVEYTTATNSFVAMLEGHVRIIEGKTYIDSGILSDETPFQQFETYRNKVIDNSISLSVDGYKWNRVDTLLYSEPDDEVFEVKKEIDHKNICTTGDNFSGKIPTGTVVLSYRVGGGRRGNLGRNLIVNLISTITYHGSSITLETTNDSPTKNGGQEMTLERAKIVGPSTIFSLDRAVTGEDVESLLENYPGISRVVAISSRGKKDVVILGSGSVPLEKSIKNEILSYLSKRSIGGDSEIYIHDPIFVFVDIHIKLKMKKDSSKSFEIAKEMVKRDLNLFFNPDENPRLTFGKSRNEEGNLFSSDIYNIADDDEKDVEYALIPVFTIRPRISYNNYWPNDSEIENIHISQEYKRSETWRIFALTSTFFRVVGSVSGTQKNFAMSGVKYTTDDGNVSFTIQPSSDFKRNLSSATLTVMPVRNEFIPVNDSEFPVMGNILIEEVE